MPRRVRRTHVALTRRAACMYVCMYDYIAVSTRTLAPPTTGTACVGPACVGPACVGPACVGPSWHAPLQRGVVSAQPEQAVPILDHPGLRCSG